jgi:hypothetical protein
MSEKMTVFDLSKEDLEVLVKSIDFLTYVSRGMLTDLLELEKKKIKKIIYLSSPVNSYRSFLDWITENIDKMRIKYNIEKKTHTSEKETD